MLVEIRDKIIFNDKNYIVVYAGNKYITCCELGVSKIHIIPINLSVFVEMYANNEIVLTRKTQNNKVYDYANLNESVRNRFDKTVYLINEFNDIYGPTYVDLSAMKHNQKLQGLIANCGFKKKAFWQKIRKYLQSGLDIYSCLDKRMEIKHQIAEYKTKTGPPGKSVYGVGVVLNGETYANFDKAIEQFKSGKYKTLTYAHEWMVTNLYLKNHNEISLADIPENLYPTYKQFYGYVKKKLTSKEIKIIKSSELEYENNERLTTSDTSLNVNGPMDLVEIDACELDLSIVNKDFESIDRPVVYLMRDVYSRAIIAYSMSFENNSYKGFTNCFAFLAKDKVMWFKKFGLNIKDFPTLCIPNRLRTDRGSDFISKQVERLMRENGISIEHVPPRSGSKKGNVEHSFDTLQRGLSPWLEGLGYITKDYGSKHHIEASLLIHEAEKLLILEIDYLNHKKRKFRNEGIDITDSVMSPMEMWNKGIEIFGPPRPIVNETLFKYSLLSDINTKISRKGITYKGDLNYWIEGNPYLENLAQEAGDTKKPFPTRIDTRDIECIYKEINGELLVIPLNPKISGNLSHAGQSLYEYEKLHQFELDNMRSIRQENLLMKLGLNNEIEKVTKSSQKRKILRQKEKKERSMEEKIFNPIVKEEPLMIETKANVSEVDQISLFDILENFDD